MTTIAPAMTSTHVSAIRSRAALAGLIGLAAAGCMVSGMARAGDEPVAVTVTDKGCEPNTLAVSAGKTVFKIKNASNRAIEWEILQGNMVVEERENIIPGFVQNISATLQAGEYGITCGLLSNPKGTLNVTAATETKN